MKWVPVTPPVFNEGEGANCGTGSGGFKPGNKCAKGVGSGRRLPGSGSPEDTWKEYDYARAMMLISSGRSVKAGDPKGNGSNWSSDEVEHLKDATARLQEKAKSTISRHKELIRGEVHAGDFDPYSEYQVGETIRLNKLTAASPRLDVAETYTDPQYAGSPDNYSQVILRFKDPKGVRAARIDVAEEVLPAGGRWRVSKVYDDFDARVNVELEPED